MSTNLKTNFDDILENLAAASTAYERFTEILSHPAVIADKKAEKPKAVHLLEIIEQSYHAYLPVELVKLVLIIKLPGAGALETRSTNLWAGNKHYEGLDITPALHSMTQQAAQWQMALDAQIGNEQLTQVIGNIRYYRNQIEKVLGEIISFYHIS